MNKYKLKTPFFALAPMANITTYPFASQAAGYGADLVWTPMVHTDTIINNWPEAENILDFKEIGSYLVQIVGSEPEKFAEAVKIIEKHLQPLGIDLNFACPDKNIVKSGCGGSLMQDVVRMVEIVTAVKSVTKRPVSVKTRAGYTNRNEIFEIIPALIGAGIDLLTVHPRVVTQKFTGSADWSVVKKIKERFPDLLLAGSGDVSSWREALERQAETGCDGILIGRAALGHPWIFEELQDQNDYSAEIYEIKNQALDLAVKANEIWGEKGIIESRTHFANYFKGFPGAVEYRKQLMSARALAEVKKILK